MDKSEEHFQNQLQALRETDFERLKRSELGVHHNFEKAAEKLNAVAKNLIYIVENKEKVNLPKEDIDRLRSATHQLTELIQRVVNFNPIDDQNANTTHTNIESEAENIYQENLRRFEHMKERVNFLNLDSQRLLDDWESQRKMLEELSKAMTTEADNLEAKKQELEASAKDQKENMERIIEENKATLQEIRNSLGQGGASISSNAFEKQAKSHEKSARLWLLLSILSITGTLLLISYMFNSEHFRISDFKNYGEVISIISYKLLVLSVAYVTIKQSLKNYRVNLHLQILNKHRQLTLDVYQLMVGANSNPDQANTIVSQASKAIFDMGSTGYLEKDEPSTTPINLTEVITKVIDSKN